MNPMLYGPRLLRIDSIARRYAAEMMDTGTRAAGSISRSFDELERNAASFEMKGGLGPDFFAAPVEAAATRLSASVRVASERSAGGILPHAPMAVPPGHFLG